MKRKILYLVFGIIVITIFYVLIANKIEQLKFQDSQKDAMNYMHELSEYVINNAEYFEELSAFALTLKNKDIIYYETVSVNEKMKNNWVVIDHAFNEASYMYNSMFDTYYVRFYTQKDDWIFYLIYDETGTYNRSGKTALTDNLSIHIEYSPEKSRFNME